MDIGDYISDQAIMQGLGIVDKPKSKREVAQQAAEAEMHAYRLANEPGYADSIKWGEETSKQGLQDMSAMFIPAGRVGNGLVGTKQAALSGEVLPTISKVPRYATSTAGKGKRQGMGELLDAESAFAMQQVARDNAIRKGTSMASGKQQGRELSKVQFELQDSARRNAIEEGLNNAYVARGTRGKKAYAEMQAIEDAKWQARIAEEMYGK